MTNTTTIEITDDQKAELDALKQHDREAYKSVIGRLLDSADQDTEAMYPVGDDEPAERLEQALADAGSSLTYDDVKAACASAIREELPVERMG